MVSQFSLQKAGSREAEYEDAIAVSRMRGRFAVADGASDSSYARLWARLLAVFFARGSISGASLDDELRPLREDWARLVDGRSLPWYAAEKARRGAFAALAGLRLDDTGTWWALAVGDCCVFQVRRGALLSAFPMTSADDFGVAPYLLASRPERNTELAQFVRTAVGSWRRGDLFLLMSDALAAFFLRRVVRDKRTPLGALDFRPRSQQRFAEWIGNARNSGELRNDDVSLIAVFAR